MTKTSLVKGTAVLAAAGLFVKFLGAFFRIPLANMIGAAGMASYAPAYSLYNFLLVFSTAGIPVAVSKMVSERQADGRCREAAQVFHLSRMLMFITGITGFGIVFLYVRSQGCFMYRVHLFRCELWHRHCFWSRWLLPIVDISRE